MSKANLICLLRKKCIAFIVISICNLYAMYEGYLFMFMIIILNHFRKRVPLRKHIEALTQWIGDPSFFYYLLIVTLTSFCRVHYMESGFCSCILTVMFICILF